MRTLLKYLAPYKWTVMLALLLAAINQTFSMLDPYFFGRIVDNLMVHPFEKGHYIVGKAGKIFVSEGPRSRSEFIWDAMWYLGILIGVAMVSRIAKAFQDYF